VEVKAPQTLRTLHNFSSKDPAVLSFNAKDIINVLDVGSGTDWWKGELDGRIGMFPRTYCEEIPGEGEEKQGSFVLVDNGSSVFLANSSTQVQQEHDSRYISHFEGFTNRSGDTGHLSFGRGDTVEGPDVRGPDSKDTMTVSLLHSQYSQVSIHLHCIPFAHNAFGDSRVVGIIPLQLQSRYPVLSFQRSQK
jgi:Variant SH3 domain